MYASGYLEMKDFLRLGVPMLLIGITLLIVLSATYWVAVGFQGMPLQ